MCTVKHARQETQHAILRRHALHLPARRQQRMPTPCSSAHRAEYGDAIEISTRTNNTELNFISATSSGRACAQRTGTATRRKRPDGLTKPAFHAGRTASPFCASFCHRSENGTALTACTIHSVKDATTRSHGARGDYSYTEAECACAKKTGATTRESFQRDRHVGLTSPASHACASGSASPFRAC